ncbi:MAG: aldose 1-epimerase family protein [Candidatus Cyclobacteriaceae bacterium M3_2C_046]
MFTEKNQLLQYVGNHSQLMGAQKYTIEEGPGKGNSIIRVRNGKALDFTITPDRGLDVFEIYFKGIPLAWISKNGLVGNQHYEPEGMGWLRSFPGGMINTCGLRNAGVPVNDQGEAFGLHGRYSHLPADKVNTLEHWQQNQYDIKVSGLVRQANTFAENLLNYRTIEVNNQNDEIILSDRIMNEGFRSEQLMILYHLNWGYPLLSQNTELVLDANTITMRDKHQEKHLNEWNQFSEPIPGYQEVVFFHDLKEDARGQVCYTLRNRKIGVQVQVKWLKDQLPYLTQWKMMGQGEYVVGLEPGNCYPMGRIEEREQNRSEFLQPGQAKDIKLHFLFSEI